MQSIGIEICNYGPVTKTNSGKLLTYVNSELSPSQVCDLGYHFRGYQNHHKYSNKQIASLKELLLILGNKFNIDIRKGIVPLLNKPGGEAFELNGDALNGKQGIWSHTSVRKDKFDVHPQDELIAMLRTL